MSIPSGYTSTLGGERERKEGEEGKTRRKKEGETRRKK